MLVEKPAGIGTAADRGRARGGGAGAALVKVGFNHRFHPGLMRAVEEARSASTARSCNLRARYGHGGRLGYEREWRADPRVPAAAS